MVVYIFNKNMDDVRESWIVIVGGNPMWAKGEPIAGGLIALSFKLYPFWVSKEDFLKRNKTIFADNKYKPIPETKPCPTCNQIWCKCPTPGQLRHRKRTEKKSKEICVPHNGRPFWTTHNRAGNCGPHLDDAELYKFKLSKYIKYPFSEVWAESVRLGNEKT
jgi:hypothetical protein